MESSTEELREQAREIFVQSEGSVKDIAIIVFGRTYLTNMILRRIADMDRVGLIRFIKDIKNG